MLRVNLPPAWSMFHSCAAVLRQDVYTGRPKCKCFSGKGFIAEDGAAPFFESVNVVLLSAIDDDHAIDHRLSG